MPNITTVSDFKKGEIAIPNAVSLNAGEGVNGDLQEIIDKYERDLLVKALGLDQYNTLQDELLKEPFVPGAGQTAAQEWQDFVLGQGAYQGVKRILRNYIYCFYLRFDEISYTTTGAAKASVQNATVADLNQKYVERWNEFVYWYQDGDEEDHSLNKFLTDTADLDESKFQLFNYENSFGL